MKRTEGRTDEKKTKRTDEVIDEKETICWALGPRRRLLPALGVFGWPI